MKNSSSISVTNFFCITFPTEIVPDFKMTRYNKSSFHSNLLEDSKTLSQREKKQAFWTRFQMVETIQIPEMIKVGVVTIDMSIISTKFENFVLAGCRDLGWHCGRTVYCQKPIILPKLVLFFGTFLELPVLPSIICDRYINWRKLESLVWNKNLDWHALFPWSSVYVCW